VFIIHSATLLYHLPRWASHHTAAQAFSDPCPVTAKWSIIQGQLPQPGKEIPNLPPTPFFLSNGKRKSSIFVNFLGVMRFFLLSGEKIDVWVAPNLVSLYEKNAKFLASVYIK
jgi:hypothetical protein